MHPFTGILLDFFPFGCYLILVEETISWSYRLFCLEWLLWITFRIEIFGNLCFEDCFVKISQFTFRKNIVVLTKKNHLFWWLIYEFPLTFETYDYYWDNRVHRSYHMDNHGCHYSETFHRCMDHFRIETYLTDTLCPLLPHLLFYVFSIYKFCMFFVCLVLWIIFMRMFTIYIQWKNVFDVVVKMIQKFEKMIKNNAFQRTKRKLVMRRKKCTYCRIVRQNNRGNRSVHRNKLWSECNHHSSIAILLDGIHLKIEQFSFNNFSGWQNEWVWRFCKQTWIANTVWFIRSIRAITISVTFTVTRNALTITACIFVRAATVGSLFMVSKWIKYSKREAKRDNVNEKSLKWNGIENKFDSRITTKVWNSCNSK